MEGIQRRRDLYDSFYLLRIQVLRTQALPLIFIFGPNKLVGKMMERWMLILKIYERFISGMWLSGITI